jgi:citrate lyase gamma subunit
MSIIIVRVSGTVGNSEIVAVVTNTPIEDVHTQINSFAEDQYGQWASVEYLETFQAPSAKPAYNIDRVVLIDELN